MLDDLKKTMRHEFLNRIDKVIVFRALTKKDIDRIIISVGTKKDALTFATIAE